MPVAYRARTKTRTHNKLWDTYKDDDKLNLSYALPKAKPQLRTTWDTYKDDDKLNLSYALPKPQLRTT